MAEFTTRQCTCANCNNKHVSQSTYYRHKTARQEAAHAAASRTADLARSIASMAPSNRPVTMSTMGKRKPMEGASGSTKRVRQSTLSSDLDTTQRTEVRYCTSI